MDSQDTQALSAIVTAVATAVLAVITFFYARHTSKMAKAMARQIVPDIHIDGANVALSPLPGFRDGAVVDCIFRAFIRNTNSASGSIVEPDLFAILDDGTELKAGTTEEEFRILLLSGGELQAANIRYRFLIPHSDPAWMEKATKLPSSTTRFRISCMDNLGIDRGKGVQVTLINRRESQPS